MMRALLSLVFLMIFSSPLFAAVDSVRFNHLEFPLKPGWENLSIFHSGFGLNISEKRDDIGAGTLAVSVMRPKEFMIDLEDGSEVSMVGLLRDHLQDETKPSEDSDILQSLASSFPETVAIPHDCLQVFIETEPHLPGSVKAYILYKEHDPIEVVASMSKDELGQYLLEVRPAQRGEIH